MKNIQELAQTHKTNAKVATKHAIMCIPPKRFAPHNEADNGYAIKSIALLYRVAMVNAMSYQSWNFL